MVLRETLLGWLGFASFFGTGAAIGIVFSLHFANRGASAPAAVLFGAGLGSISVWMLVRYTYCIQHLVRLGRWPRDPSTTPLFDGAVALVVGLPIFLLFLRSLRELIER